jgi:ribonucleoside-triphosphate reductase
MSLPTQYQQYIHQSRYARWNDKEKRRETWEESVKRYVDFFEEHLKDECDYVVPQEEKELVYNAIVNLEVMPSMRALWTAGPALKRDNIAGYNCSYVAVDRTTSFDEILYILMNGTGVGFSVERQFVSQLPLVAEDFYPTGTTIVVEDSKLGWAKALKELIHLLYGGQIPKWDLSKLRPAGAKLKVFGGRSSGPDPLNDLFKFAVNIFKGAAGRKLTSLECHDLVCKIAEIVVVGGVRRSALISLSNLSDDRMRMAKSGNWWEHHVQRALSNNSAAYTEKPDIGIFMKEWLALYESKSGERGIFNRVASQRKVKENGRRDPDHEFGTNPCGEIILRPFEFCNLSEVVVRSDDTWETLHRKVKIAAIIGTWQSTLVKFKYINKKWQRNCEEERLLGVSLTGIMDHPILNAKSNREALQTNLVELKNTAIDTNKEHAEKLGIPQSAAITTMKPSGTVSQLVDSASGIHARHSEYYIRTVRQDKKDPLGKFMFDAGIPAEDDVTKPEHTWVFSFPIKSPETSVVRTEMSAIDQLETWLLYRTYWCEHNPSVTISVKENEWMEVGAWVYERFNDVGGVSFLPASDHNYRQAPYQECSKEDYDNLLAKMPNLDWQGMRYYEQEDNTEGAGNYACVAGNCEL